MRHFLLIPVVVSALALAAHLLRGGHLAFALAAAALPLLLAFRQLAALRVVQVALLLGALEWLRALTEILALRRALGQPWHRLVAILGSVALVSAFSAFAAERWYRGKGRRRGPRVPAEAA